MLICVSNVSINSVAWIQNGKFVPERKNHLSMQGVTDVSSSRDPCRRLFKPTAAATLAKLTVHIAA